MIEIREGELTELALSDSEVRYLRQVLRGNALVTPTRLRVQRLAGVWSLPSGRTLVVVPRKGTGADLFAWMCAVDPRLFELSSGTASAGASTGGLIEAAAHAFCYQLAATLHRSGPRQQYGERRDLQSSVRGRIDWATYARHPLPSRVPCVFWERDLDTPLNRLFARVLRQLASAETVGSSATPFPELIDMFGHVPANPPAAILDLDRPLPRLDAAFAPARALAVVLHECLGLAFTGQQSAFSFQLDLARLFEKSVERALSSVRWVAAPSLQFRPAYQGNSAGEGGWSAIDALLSTERGHVVVETKYAAAFSKSHLYQILAYMKMVDSAVGVLVYPKGAELSTRRFRSLHATRWEVHVVELDPVRVAQQRAQALRDFALDVCECIQTQLVSTAVS